MDGYVPWWAFTVDEIDEYRKSVVEWVAQKRKDLFDGDDKEPEEPSISNTPLPAQDKRSDLKPAPQEMKDSSIKSTPLKSNDNTPTDKGKQDLKPESEATDDTKKTAVPLEGNDKQVTIPEKVIQEPIVEQKKAVKSEKPEETRQPVDTAKDDNLTTAKGPDKQHEPAQKNIEPNVVKCLDQFTEACGAVVDSNLMLSKAMEKARSDVALALLQPSPDNEKLAELEKTTAETTTSLKQKVEESYSNYCNSHLVLLEVIKEATDASLVSTAQESIFKQSVFIQASEDRVRVNKAIDSIFSHFIDTIKSSESEIAKELAELDAPADVKPGLEATAVLLLAERRIKLLHDKLKQLSPSEIAKSLEKQRTELVKLYEERIQNALDDSRTDMQQRTEERVRCNCVGIKIVHA